MRLEKPFFAKFIRPQFNFRLLSRMLPILSLNLDPVNAELRLPASVSPIREGLLQLRHCPLRDHRRDENEGESAATRASQLGMQVAVLLGKLNNVFQRRMRDIERFKQFLVVVDEGFQTLVFLFGVAIAGHVLQNDQ